jgi:hypothetical protein
MSARSKVRPGGQWYGTTTIGPRQLCALDQRVSELINIDGGTWNPTNHITFGGVGLKLNGVGGLTGGVTTKMGYGGDEPRIRLPASTWPSFSTPSTRTRSIFVPATGIENGAFVASFPTMTFVNSDGVPVRYRYELPTFPDLYGVMSVPQMRFHDGATLTKATFYYKFIGPKLLGTERLGVFRVDASNTIQALCTTHTSSGIVYSDATTYTGGAKRDVSTADAYYADGATIALEFVPDQYNVIDTSAYVYQVRAYFEDVWPIIYGVKFDFTIPNRRYE